MTQVKIIATNSLALKNYFIKEVVEAGLVLQGTEIKSIRAQSPNLRDAFVDVSGNQLEGWLINSHIAPYSHGNRWNHEPTRKRKLLLHKNQINRLFGAIHQKGMTVIPTKMYFKNGKVKVELGIGKGKKHEDKRETIKRKTADREMERALKRSKR